MEKRACPESNDAPAGRPCDATTSALNQSLWSHYILVSENGCWNSEIYALFENTDVQFGKIGKGISIFEAGVRRIVSTDWGKWWEYVLL